MTDDRWDRPELGGEVPGAAFLETADPRDLDRVLTRTGRPRFDPAADWSDLPCHRSRTRRWALTASAVVLLAVVGWGLAGQLLALLGWGG